MPVSMRRFALISLIAVTAATPLLAAGSDSVRARIHGYRELGAAFKAVNDGLRGTPQTVLIQQSARQIRNVAREQYSWFPAGSDASAGVRTAVKADVWSRPVPFRAAQDAFARQTEVFQRAAAGGNVATMRAEARKLGGTCKGCHDGFRLPPAQ